MGEITPYANPAVYIVEGLLVFFILYKIISARRGRELFVRRIPGLSSLDEAVGRATEMGKPMLFVPGIGGLTVVGLQAMAILQHVVQRAARFLTRVIVPNIDPIMFTISEEISKEAYAAEGVPEQFDPEDIRYLSSDQFALAAGVVGIMHRDKTATVLYFGEFFAEALILAENGQMVGAIQIAGTPSITQVPFFLAACDYTIIGDEYYAASAYLSREPTLLGSLVGQDYGKLLMMGLIVIGAIAVTLMSVVHLLPGLGWLITPWLDCLNTHFLKYFPR